MGLVPLKPRSVKAWPKFNIPECSDGQQKGSWDHKSVVSSGDVRKRLSSTLQELQNVSTSSHDSREWNSIQVEELRRISSGSRFNHVRVSSFTSYIIILDFLRTIWCATVNARLFRRFFMINGRFYVRQKVKQCARVQNFWRIIESAD